MIFCFWKVIKPLFYPTCPVAGYMYFGIADLILIINVIKNLLPNIITAFSRYKIFRINKLRSSFTNISSSLVNVNKFA